MDSGGRLGANALLSVFTIPLKINASIRSLHTGATHVRIVGLPELSFQKDDEMDAFVEYMNAHIAAVSEREREREVRLE